MSKMTREEAIEFIAQSVKSNVDMAKIVDAIKALSQDPCDDAISREAVVQTIEDAKNAGELTFARTIKRIMELPPVTPKPETVTEFADRCRECGAKYGKLLKQKSGKWIPVSERLPEDEQEILFSTKTGRVHSGKYHDDDSANQWYSYRDKCRAWNNVVTAWMPLPTPYEPQERSDKE